MANRYRTAVGATFGLHRVLVMPMLSGLIGAAFLAVCIALAPVAANAQGTVRDKFGDWVLRCDTPPGALPADIDDVFPRAYANPADFWPRLKVAARARVTDAVDAPDLVARVADPAYPARIERVIVFDVVAFDWNCPQHITPRFTEAEWQALP